MAEVQTDTQMGALGQRFVEFVMMHAQNAALFLGQIPNPQTGQGEVNLELAKMFIDQLAMIQEKTRGNLSNEESTVLRNAIANLQMAYVEVSQSAPTGKSVATEPAEEEEKSVPDVAPKSADEPALTPETPGVESRKKFTKSYGA